MSTENVYYSNTENEAVTPVNDTKLTTGQTTRWLDTKLFPTVQVTVKESNLRGKAIYILWGIGHYDDQPAVGYRPLAVDQILPTLTSKTYQFDTKSRWMRILFPLSNGDGTLSYVMKPTTTEIKIVDDSGSIVAVSQHAMKIILTDNSGAHNALKTTNPVSTGEALYISLTDASGAPLAVVDNSTLSVALRDNSGVDLGFTSTSGYSFLQRTTINPVFDIIFVMHRSGYEGAIYGDTYSAMNSVIKSSQFTISGIRDGSFINVTSVSLDGEASNLESIKKGYVLSTSLGRVSDYYISDVSINGSQLTISHIVGNVTLDFETFEGYYSSSAELIKSALVHDLVLPVTSSLDSNLGSTGVQIAFNASNNRADYGINLSQFTTSIESSLNEMLRAHNTTANSLFDVINGLVGDTGYTRRPDASQVLVVITTDAISDNKNDVTDYNDTSFNDIYVVRVGHTDPKAHSLVKTSRSAVHDYDLSSHIIDMSGSVEADYVSATQSIVNRILGDFYYRNNALMILPTDLSGHAQASIDVSALAAFGHVALCYALADVSGRSIGTTHKSIDMSNALYVHACDQSGHSYTFDNPLPIAIQGDAIEGYVSDTSLGDGHSALINDRINVMHIGLNNESAVPIWFKIYDWSDNTVIDYSILKNKIKYNLAVPPASSRDIQFDKSVTFESGITARVSTKHDYDASADGELGGNRGFISVTYSPLLLE